jgi:hypothetical protein
MYIMLSIIVLSNYTLSGLSLVSLDFGLTTAYSP